MFVLSVFRCSHVISQRSSIHWRWFLLRRESLLHRFTMKPERSYHCL